MVYRIIFSLILTLLLPATVHAEEPPLGEASVNYITQVLIPHVDRDLLPVPWYMPAETFILESYDHHTTHQAEKAVWTNLESAGLASSWDFGLGISFRLKKKNFVGAKKYLKEALAKYQKGLEDAKVEAQQNAAAEMKASEDEKKIKAQKLSVKKNKLLGEWYITDSNGDISYMVFMKLVSGYLTANICKPDQTRFPNIQKSCPSKNMVKVESFYDNPVAEKFCLNGDTTCSVKIESSTVAGVFDYERDETSEGPSGHLQPLTVQKLTEFIKIKTDSNADMNRQLHAFPSQWEGVYGIHARLRIWPTPVKHNAIQILVCSVETGLSSNSPCLPYSDNFKSVLTLSYQPAYNAFVDVRGDSGVRVTQDGQLAWFTLSVTSEGSTDDKIKSDAKTNIYTLLDRRALEERLRLQNMLQQDKNRQLKALIGDWYSPSYGDQWTEDVRRIWVDKQHPNRVLIGTCTVKIYRASKGKKCTLIEDETARPLVYNSDFRGFCIGNHTNCAPGIRMPRKDTNRFIYIDDPSKQLQTQDSDLNGYSFNRISSSFVY